VWKVDPAENPDWGYARNRQILLKASNAEYSTSTFTAPIKVSGMTFYGGNRDYCWQGLIVGPLNGVLYKVLDAVYFALPDSTIQAKDVIYLVNKCIYHYVNDQGKEVSVKFSLKSVANEVSLRVKANQRCWFTIWMDSNLTSRYSKLERRFEGKEPCVVLKPSTTPLRIIVEEFDRLEPLNMELEWRYKLGDGFRKVENEVVKFVEQRRKIYAPMMFFSSKGTLKVKVPLYKHATTCQSDMKIIRKLAPITAGSVVADAIALRFKTLSTYSSFIGDVWFPHAGAWWFNKPWVRDALEGVRWNMKTYLKLFGWTRGVKSLLDYLLAFLKSHKGLPTIIGVQEQFSSDAPPQLLYVTSKICEMIGGGALFSKLLDVARMVSQRLLEGLPISFSVLCGSIICSPANSSWIDTVITLDGLPWPTRLPLEWMSRDVNPFKSEFGLIEVNALYIEALETLIAVSKRMGYEAPWGVEELLRTLKAGFTRFFKEAGNVPPLTVAPSYGLIDKTLGSPIIVGVTALKDGVYKGEELGEIWRTVKRRLLVHRRLLALGKGSQPFGVLVKDVERVPYLGDMEYHGPTVWPRDTPYLFKLMEAVGENPLGLLVSNLDHMVCEGVIGYCGELFSLPVGRNPSPSAESENPVPVKNPAQYWSHWCDPFLEHLTDLLGNHRF